MTFTKTDKLKAFAIVKVFETSRPFGDYAACVVLDDGAGISYGVSQFTHRSGSLLAVVERYLKNGGTVGSNVLTQSLNALRDVSGRSIARTSANETLKKALRAAAVTREMKVAQMAVTTELYLNPAIAACKRYGFTQPLSLAVVFDSVVHGSFYRVARGVGVGAANERAWITDYVRRRDTWLASYPRLAATRYRTRFFLGQIAISNWELKLPLNVHGVRLTDAMFPAEAAAPSVPTTSTLEKAGETLTHAAERFDRVERVVTTVATRTDSAKSLWTTLIGTVWQTAWATFAFVAGLPREFWITVAVIAGLLMLAYLYRQIALGKIREQLATGH
ncbi:MAG: chitosanase [Pyrinomonadaceae bacterium]|nr:chitosanase [Pyrinomonadaceae bacterium]MBP6213431.1 chitosanase [Pyrinomonadaceae bacterium]